MIDAKDGAICVKAIESMTYENVVLTVFNYGRDYMLSVDLKVSDSVDSTRWAPCLMVRYDAQDQMKYGKVAFTFDRITADYVARTDKKALAGFRVESMEVAENFAVYVEENNIVDIMVISSDPEILPAACNRRAGVHVLYGHNSWQQKKIYSTFRLAEYPYG